MRTGSRWFALLIFSLVMLSGGWSYRNWLQGILAEKAAAKDSALFWYDAKEDEDPLKIVSTISNIDPLKGDMTVRLDTSAEEGLLNADGTLTKELRILVNSVNGKAEYVFKKGENLGPIEYTTSLSGGTFKYPDDRYQAYLEVSASSPLWNDPQHSKDAAPDDSEEVPIEVEGYVGVGGFQVCKGNLQDMFDKDVQATAPGEFRVVLDMQRSKPVKLFARFILTLQWMLALAALSVSLRVVIGGRKCELALFTWLTAMLFALPPMRNAMVGVPSIGIYVDFLGFLCCEGLVACSLAALVLTWHVRKPG